MSIRGPGRDFRDDLRSLAYCYHNLALLGLNADAILKGVAQISPPDFAQLLWGFIEREPEEKSLQAWGLHIVQTPKGPVATFTA